MVGKTEYGTPRTYMDDHLEEFCPVDIENTLKLYCGILDEELHSDLEDDFPGKALDKAMCAEFSDDIDSLTPIEGEPPDGSRSPFDYESYGEGLTLTERESYVDSVTFTD